MKFTKRKPNPRWPAGIPIPYAPTQSTVVPTADAWPHEIKHDGYRLLVRRDGKSVQIITETCASFRWRCGTIFQRQASGWKPSQPKRA